MNIALDQYASYSMIEYADGETEWLTDAELARMDDARQFKVAAIMVTLDAPEGGITNEWRESMGAALMDSIATATGWDTLDESNDRDISEFVIDLKAV